jgi:hypothetical protein
VKSSEVVTALAWGLFSTFLAAYSAAQAFDLDAFWLVIAGLNVWMALVWLNELKERR